MRWTLSQEQVAAAVPPGFIDLFEKAVPVGPVSKPITEAETSKVQELAKSHISQFQRDEQGVAMNLDEPAYHHCCPHSMV